MSKPPPLPAEMLARVLRIAGIDGYTLIFIAGGFGFISGSSRDVLGALTGLLATGAGFIELHGRKRLRAGDCAGISWLVQSQLALLAVILFYIAYQLHNFDVQPLLATVDHALAIAQQSLDVDVTSLAG